MAKVTDHPQLGRLIPDQLGEDLMFFHQFAEAKLFWHPNSKKQLEDLEPEQRALVKRWKEQPGELPQICRNFDVLAALQSMGVYEVGLLGDPESDESVPTDLQVATWTDFLESEQNFFANSFDALVRYYKHLREIEPELFEGETDCPETAESIEDLLTCIRFDGMSLSPESISGVSTISFGWEVDWDMEHGLQMLFHQGEVIAMGNAIFGPEDVLSEANYFREIMNDDEQATYAAFASQCQPGDE